MAIITCGRRGKPPLIPTLFLESERCLLFTLISIRADQSKSEIDRLSGYWLLAIRAGYARAWSLAIFPVAGGDFFRRRL
jgi:hypothetical protein